MNKGLKMHRFKFGERVVPEKLRLDDLPPLVKGTAEIDMDALRRLRQRQRELGVLDASGNLYDPRTKKWSCSNMTVEGEKEDLYSDLHYFVHYPEMERGLPPATKAADFGVGESAMGITTDTAFRFK